jgi:hypothetical protein
VVGNDMLHRLVGVIDVVRAVVVVMVTFFLPVQRRVFKVGQQPRSLTNDFEGPCGGVYPRVGTPSLAQVDWASPRRRTCATCRDINSQGCRGDVKPAGVT